VDDILLEDVDASHNNWRGERWGTTTWFVSGFKLLDVTDVVVRRMTTSHNRAIGFWLDSDIARTTIDGLVANHNWEEGVHLEAADGPIYLRDSVVCANRKAGVAGRDADNIILERCLLANNAGAQLEVKGEQPRGDSDGELFIGRGKSRDAHRRFPRHYALHDCAVGCIGINSHSLISARLKGANMTPEKQRALHAAFVSTLSTQGNVWFASKDSAAFQAEDDSPLDFAGWLKLAPDRSARWNEEALHTRLHIAGAPTEVVATIAPSVGETNA